MKKFVVIRINKETGELSYKANNPGSREIKWSTNKNDVKEYTYSGASGWVKTLINKEFSKKYDYKSECFSKQIDLFVEDMKLENNTYEEYTSEKVIDETSLVQEESRQDETLDDFEVRILELIKNNTLEFDTSNYYVIYIGDSVYGTEQYLVFYNDSDTVYISSVPAMSTQERCQQALDSFQKQLETQKERKLHKVKNFNPQIIRRPEKFKYLPIIS